MKTTAGHSFMSFPFSTMVAMQLVAVSTADLQPFPYPESGNVSFYVANQEMGVEAKPFPWQYIAPVTMAATPTVAAPSLFYWKMHKREAR